MKLKYNFCFQPLGDNFIGVAVGENAAEFCGTLQLDEVAHDIVTHIQDDISRDALIDQMLTIYDDDRDLVAKYVDQVLQHLASEGILIL